MFRIHYAALPVLTGALASPLLMNCGAVKDLQEATSGCDEINQGSAAVSQLNVDASVKGFAIASSELKASVGRIKVEVKAACVDICNRLQVPDSWSAHGDDDAAISNDQGTGACDKAAAQIDLIMREVKGTANFALTTTAPKCSVDVAAQASCESNCQIDASCKPGQIDVVTRCDPAELSVQCDGTCNANAVCQGTLEAAAQCDGTCDATCQGTCAGTCIAETGVATTDQATCVGKCKGTCKGTCTGECHVTATGGIACGAAATCRGGCTGTFSAPKCESELRALPPECHADASCEVSCTSRASSSVTCTPPKVVLMTDVNVSPKVAALKAAIEANFPKLILVARAEGPVVQKAVTDMAATGTAVVNGAATLSAKSVACAATAAEVAGKASFTIDASVKGSAKVHDSCRANES